MDNIKKAIPFQISLKAARVNADLSQRQAAKEFDIDVSTLRSYEQGETVPDWDLVNKIEAVYNISADYIFLRRKSALSGVNEQQTQNRA